jgi:hypothetical protein
LNSSETASSMGNWWPQFGHFISAAIKFFVKINMF